MAGCLLDVKSWNAKWEGREKYYHVGVWVRVEEALCSSVLVGSAMNPNCCVILFRTVVAACSDRWRKFFSSVVIVNTCTAWSFFRVRLRRRWWYRRLFLFVGCVVESLVVAFDILKWTIRVVIDLFELWLGITSFCWRGLLGPSSSSCFFVVIVQVILGVCCIFVQENGSFCHVCRIIFYELL